METPRIEPSTLLGRVYTTRFRVVAMGLNAQQTPEATLELATGLYAISLDELVTLVASGLMIEEEDP